MCVWLCFWVIYSNAVGFNWASLYFCTVYTGGGGGGGGAKSQWAYVGSYTTFVFYIRGLLLNADGILYLLVRGFRRQNSKNSNILDHTHLILKHLYCWLWTCWTPNYFRDGRLLNVPSDLKKWGKIRIRSEFLVYLVSLIDWVIMWHGDTTP